MMSPSSAPMHMVCLFAASDRDAYSELRKHLAPQVRARLLTLWSLFEVQPGALTKQVETEKLDEANVVVLLISSDFLADEHLGSVCDKILERRAAGRCEVVPVLIRATDLQQSRLAAFQALPRNGQPVLSWDDCDAAWVEVVQSLLSRSSRVLGPIAIGPRRRVAWWGIALAISGLMLAITALMLCERHLSPHPPPPPPPPVLDGMVLISGAPGSPSFFLDTAEVTNDSFTDWLNQHRFEVKDRAVHSQGEELLRLSPEVFGGIDFQQTMHRYIVLAGQSQRPVVWVSWAGARRYCQSRGKRLPTSEEWIAAAYGPADQRSYPWGEQLLDCGRAVFGRWDGLACPNEARGSAVVRSTSGDRTPEGVYDLGGNVAEWVANDDAKGHRFFGGDHSRSAAPILEKTKRLSHLVDATGKPIHDGMGSNVGFRCAQSLPISPVAPTKE